MPVVTARGGPKKLWFQTVFWADAGAAPPIAVATNQAAAIVPATTNRGARIISHLPQSSLPPESSAGALSHAGATACGERRSEEHTSELQSQSNLVCRLLL